MYLDNEPVGLLGDPRPQVAKVLAAGGHAFERVDVLLLEGRDDAKGIRLDPEDVLDRTEQPTRAIYLTIVERAGDGDGLELDAAEGVGAVAARIGSGTGGASQFGQGNGPPLDLGPGVSGEGNERGGPQSAYSRTGTDTAEPGMTEQDAQAAGFGSGAGKGTSSGARESGKPTTGRSRMAAGLEDPFGKEGLTKPTEAAQDPQPVDGPSGLGASNPVRVVGRSGTASEAEPAQPDPATTASDS
ncbi:MAG TPA: hypothetical protein VM241_08745 [Candidatus Thermoplasmatota archaeon]|nr:hypothetical protein [Candidatus Thermoplasmatota archaeon]